MLAALEVGVKGGKWFSLIDKVGSQRNLMSAFTQVKRNKGSAGVDRVTIGMFGTRLEENLQRLSVSLLEGSYVPQAIRRVWIEKPGSKEKRPLGIPWGSRRFETGWFRPHSATFWSRSSSGTSQPRATGFVRNEAPRTPCAE